MRQILLNGYCDETGNSGLNLFDPDQPEIWVGTLLSRHNLQETATSELRCLLALVNENELHANKMGLSKLGQISIGLKQIYSKNNCKFVFSCINKVYFAKLKFFDYLFDNVTNPGVHMVHYGVRVLRLGLSDAFCHAISAETARQFWSIYDLPNEANIQSLLCTAEQEINHSVSDPRMLELFNSAFRGAKKNLLEVFDASKSLLDSPNTAAFSQLIVGLNTMFPGDNVSIVKFYHDAQNQFGPSLIKTYNYLKEVCPDYGSTALISDFSLVQNFTCPLQIISSQNNTGLQLIDAALWLCKRHVYSVDPIAGNCRKLVDYLLPRIKVFNLTESSMHSEFQRLYYETMQIPISPDQEQAGVKLLREMKLKAF